MCDFKELTEANFKTTVADTRQGIVIFYKELCPHCKNMEKVLTKFSARKEDVNIMRINLEQCPGASQEADVERPPTLVIIKEGVMVAKKSGLMNPKELLAFYQEA